jgi:hypothetical protein
MLTELQANQIEEAARSYCHELGLDPNKETHYVSSSGLRVSESRWRKIAPELRDLHARLEALRFAGLITQ